MVKRLFLVITCVLGFFQSASGQYTNPIIHADYSDPDVCAAGDGRHMAKTGVG